MHKLFSRSARIKDNETHLTTVEKDSIKRYQKQKKIEDSKSVVKRFNDEFKDYFYGGYDN